MAIKGQNIRLMLDGKVFAASTSCSLEVNANIESVPTKDDGDYDKLVCTGKSWSASVDALVIADEITTDSVTTNATTEKVIEQTTVYVYGGNVNIFPGQTIEIEQRHDYLYGKAYIVNYTMTSIMSSGDGTVMWRNDGSSPVQVRIALSLNLHGGVVKFRIGIIEDANTLDKLIEHKSLGTRFPVTMSLVDGPKRRNKVKDVVAGVAIIEKVVMNARNGQTTTYSVQLRGDGPLEYED